MAIFILACFILFIFGAKDKYNQTERKIYTKKFIENKSLQAADCHCIHSQHEFSYEIIVSILIKTWTPSTPLLTLWCTMLNKWCVVVFNHFKTFFQRTRPFSFFQLTSEYILLKKVQFVCIVLFDVHCCFQLQFCQVKFQGKDARKWEKVNGEWKGTITAGLFISKH